MSSDKETEAQMRGWDEETEAQEAVWHPAGQWQSQASSTQTEKQSANGPALNELLTI